VAFDDHVREVVPEKTRGGSSGPFLLLSRCGDTILQEPILRCTGVSYPLQKGKCWSYSKELIIAAALAVSSYMTSPTGPPKLPQNLQRSQEMSRHRRSGVISLAGVPSRPGGLKGNPQGAAVGRGSTSVGVCRCCYSEFER
jgi:hypothetical protein